MCLRINDLELTLTWRSLLGWRFAVSAWLLRNAVDPRLSPAAVTAI